MIIRNFLHKKNNLIYILVCFILFWLIVLIITLDNRRMEFYNEANKTAYIEFKGNYEEYERIKNLKIINSITIGIEAVTEFNGTIKIFPSTELSSNELLGSDETFKTTNNGAIIRLPYYDYELLLIGKINNNTKSFVSEEVFNILLAESNEIVYNVTLNDWSKLGKAISDINGNFPFEKGHFISVYRYSEDTSNYDTLYYIFRTLIIVILALGITFIIKDIYTQEKEKSYMYYCLGFTKWQLRALGMIKIGLLFVLGFIPFALVYGVILLL